MEENIEEAAKESAATLSEKEEVKFKELMRGAREAATGAAAEDQDTLNCPPASFAYMPAL